MSPDRVKRPSSTMQPATVPAFGSLNVCRTSAAPIRVSFSVGASSPAMAFFISSVT